MYTSLLSHLGSERAKILFQAYFSEKLSESFFDCMDLQLSKLFETITAIKITSPIWMHWAQEHGFTYTKGPVSKINAQIFLGHGFAKPCILWQSKSGRIYEIADNDINCNDIEFWFEGLDAEECNHYFKPKWSLFTIDTFKHKHIDQFKLHGIIASYEFLRCADEQLTSQFLRQTGLKINQQLCLMVPSDKIAAALKGNQVSEYKPHPPILHQVGDISRLELELIVIAHRFPVVILWHSNSGRVYKMSDTDIDCSDIQFSFENLETEKYIEQFYPQGQKLPFVLKNLPFELVVTRLNMDCNLLLAVKEGYENKREVLIKEVEGFTRKFNAASEKKSDDGEIVKKCLGTVDGKNAIIFDIDMSLAGFDYFKKLLKFLSKKEGIAKVEIA